MIFWFSGTGNTAYVARELGRMLSTETYSLVSADLSQIDFASNDNIGLVFPVYSWGVPPIVLRFVDRLVESAGDRLSGKAIWTVMTCGDETARAPEMLRRKLRSYNLDLAGGWSVVMPNNYVLLPGFDVDDDATERRKLGDAPARIKSIASKIGAEVWEEDYVRGSMARLKTAVVYPLFKRWGVFTSRWHATDECVSCGRCASACPVGNIEMRDGRPVWGRDCTSCVACYHVCPKHAVEYGRATLRKGQYVCPLK